MIHSYLVAASVALASATPIHAQSVKAGIDAWQQADYSRAVDIWRPLAERGDPDAQFNLGQAYRLGRGVPINLGAATVWFERAAKQGHIDAQTTLGLLLFQNGDHPSGLKWLRGPADKGEPRAQLIYGTALVNGDGIKSDPVLGYAYVSRAAAHGLGPAKDTLAQLDQMLSPQQRQKAAAINERAAPSTKSKLALATKTKPGEVAIARPLRAPLPPAPSVKVASVKAPPVRAAGNWRIQLGAFSQKSTAEALYRKLSGSKQFVGRQAFYVAAGPVIRFQVGPFETRAAAANACEAIGGACFPVPAK